jgi:hypothetical protein
MAGQQNVPGQMQPTQNGFNRSSSPTLGGHHGNRRPVAAGLAAGAVGGAALAAAVHHSRHGSHAQREMQIATPIQEYPTPSQEALARHSEDNISATSIYREDYQQPGAPGGVEPLFYEDGRPINRSQTHLNPGQQNFRPDSTVSLWPGPAVIDTAREQRTARGLGVEVPVMREISPQQTRTEEARSPPEIDEIEAIGPVPGGGALGRASPYGAPSSPYGGRSSPYGGRSSPYGGNRSAFETGTLGRTSPLLGRTSPLMGRRSPFAEGRKLSIDIPPRAGTALSQRAGTAMSNRAGTAMSQRAGTGMSHRSGEEEYDDDGLDEEHFEHHDDGLGDHLRPSPARTPHIRSAEIDAYPFPERSASQHLGWSPIDSPTAANHLKTPTTPKQFSDHGIP